MTESMIDQLKFYHECLKNAPSNKEILTYIFKPHKRAMWKTFYKASTQNDPITKKNTIKRGIMKHRTITLETGDDITLPNFVEFESDSKDGWENRMMCNDGSIAFVFKGYLVLMNKTKNNYEITSTKRTQILDNILTTIKAILHLNEHQCEFTEIFLQNKLGELNALYLTQYTSYVPMPPKLRRSYNVQEWKRAKDSVIDEGWNNCVKSQFDSQCYIFKLNDVVFAVDFDLAKISRIHVLY